MGGSPRVTTQEFNHISVRTYPRPSERLYRCSRLDPRGTRPVASVVWIGGGGRELGCQDAHPGAAAQAAWSRRDASRQGSLRRQRRNPVPTGRRCRGSGAVDRPLRWQAPNGVLKGQSTGGQAEQASNTARGTLEKRRTCGFVFRTAPMPRGVGVRGSFGTPASRAALTGEAQIQGAFLGRNPAARTPLHVMPGGWPGQARP